MLTLQQAIAARGLKDPKPLSVKRYRAIETTKACPRKFPDLKMQSHMITVARQSPLFVAYHDDDGVSGVQYSERTLTDWYVAEFVKLNHYKG